MNRLRGVALVLVLWVLVLLTALLASFAIVSRTESLMARQISDYTRAMYAAEAGVEIAVRRLGGSDPAYTWVPDGRAYATRFDDADLSVEVLDETAKLDINVADAVALARFFAALGVDEPEAGRLGVSIVEHRQPLDMDAATGAAPEAYLQAGFGWGPKNALFERIEELRRVPGVDQTLYRLAAPHITVYSGTTPSPAYASPPVLASLGLDPVQIEQLVEERELLADDTGGLPLPPDAFDPMVGGGTGTYSIRSVARLPDGAVAELNLTLRVGSNGVPGVAYTLLDRREGEAEP